MKATQPKAQDELLVDENGLCTVFGPEAHRMWDYGRGDYPKHKSGSQGFFIYQAVHNGVREHWQIVASQSTRELAMQYRVPYCVLVECRAPDTRPSIAQMTPGWQS